jgi:hypothetical protein
MVTDLNKNYYYLVASLPELHFGQSFQFLDINSYFSYLFEEIEESDQNKAIYLFLPYDHINLINFCLHKNSTWHPLSLYKKDTLIRCINESSSEIPSYLFEFYDDFLKGKLPMEEYKLYHVLNTRFYDIALKNTEGFIHQWMTFDRDFKNILAAVSARRNGYSLEFQLIGENSVTLRLQTNNSPDFGLQADFPFIEHLIRLSDQDNIVEMEKQIDFIRWNKIDEISTFADFSFDKAAAFMIRLLIAHRWKNLDKKEGIHIIEKKIEDLTSQVTFINDYTL